jgi:hypothetical protein
MITTHPITDPSGDYRVELLSSLVIREGFRQDPYFDPKGIVTVGYGFNIQDRAILSLVLNQLGKKKGKKKGTFYFFGVFLGRPRGRKVDSRPNRKASRSCQVGEPKGAWRLTQVRMWVSSWSASGSSQARGHVGGTSSGQGSISPGCCKLDHGQCSAFEANPARTGLFTT